ncbi:MAG: hypothetical protein EA401_07360 [Planctomycetota bacterium]|nr:MAG: hypothetical protein EA401_07360 [Planctomycetota bacterium]
MALLIYLFSWILISKLCIDASKENVRWAAIGLGILAVALHYFITYPGLGMVQAALFFIPPAVIQSGLAYLFLWSMNRVSDSIIMALFLFIIGTVVQFITFGAAWIWWIELIR